MPNTNSTAVGSPPLQRSRALSNGREPPISARSMSAAPPAVDNNSAKARGVPPPTPPRLNTPVVSPAYSSPNPNAYPHPPSLSSSKPSILQSLKVHFKPTPPATPPRPSNTHLAVSPCIGSPVLVSPLVPPKRAQGVLSASTPNDVAPKVVEWSPARARALGQSVELGSPMLTRRAHVLVASSRTSDVVCTPPRIDISKVENDSAPSSPRILLQSASDVPPPSPIASLKSSLGVTMVKSPRAKDYLLSQLAAKPVVPLTRSISPPPRTSIASPAAPDSPSRVRGLSDPLPLPTQYDHLNRTVLKGSCDTIGMPYNVTHTTHIDHANMQSIKGNNFVLINNSIPLYEKSGFLLKLAGSTFKERWVECKRSTLSYFAKKDSSKPRREIHLADCEFARDKTSKRPFTLHLIHTPTRKSYYFAAHDPQSYEEWVRVLHSSGAIDMDLVIMEKDQKEKERKQEEARKAREMKKQEDEYVKAKLKKRSTLRLINMNMSDCAMESCPCVLAVQEVAEKESGNEFKISVTFDQQNWTIYRNFEKVAKMYEAMTKLKFVKGMCPPRKCPSNMKEAEFKQLQISKLQALLDVLARNRPCVLASSVPKQRFLRFIAPVGWDDEKPAKFVMPFNFDF